MPVRLLTADELAEVIGVSVGTIAEWAKAGRIPAIRFSTRVQRFDLDEVIDAIKCQQRREAGDAS